MLAKPPAAFMAHVASRFSNIFLDTSLPLAGHLAHLTWAIKAQELQEQRCPFLTVRAVFSSVQTMLSGCQCLASVLVHRS